MERQRVMIRADGSDEIGVGHVMRCLTLADELTRHQCEITFFCKAHNASVIERIEKRGYAVNTIAIPSDFNPTSLYQRWLASSENYDAEQCIQLSDSQIYDLVIVDHYGIGQQWESMLKPFTSKIIAIDDLANREHCCDVLIDVTYGRNVNDYLNLVPENTNCLLGTDYALLRTEFSELRERAIKKRASTKSVQHILIGFGGTDPHRLTETAIRALSETEYSGRISVVISRACTWLEDFELQCQQHEVDLYIDLNETAQLMLEADLAIGSAGGMAWERCSLGLPSVIVVFAENQRLIADAVGDNRAGVVVPEESLVNYIRTGMMADFSTPVSYPLFSENAFRLCDGKGAQRVAAKVLNDERYLIT